MEMPFGLKVSVTDAGVITAAVCLVILVLAILWVYTIIPWDTFGGIEDKMWLARVTESTFESWTQKFSQEHKALIKGAANSTNEC